jgi:glycerol-3-phosphate cytidylyltransferase-like family protein
MENTELTLKEARSLAKYYGNAAQKQYDTVQTEEERREIWECLSYCRGIILKKSRGKKVEPTENKQILETA